MALSYSCKKQKSNTNEKNAVDTRMSISLLVRGIAFDNELVSNAVGIAGEETSQWRRYLKLRDKATIEELRYLTNHENPVVRAYSFQALAYRTDKDIFPILIEHLNDTTTLNTFFGCIKSSEMTGDYFISVVTPDYISDDLYKLNKDEEATLDSLLLYGKDIKLYAKSRVVEKLEPKEEIYGRVREIAIEERDLNAFVTLSKYQKQQDKQLIIDIYKRGDIYDFIRSVRYFPDEDFFPYLTEIYEKEIQKPTGFDYTMLRNLYQVLAQYKNAETRKIFERTLNIEFEYTRQYHTAFLWLALKKYPSPIFDGLIDGIEISDFQRQEFDYWMDRDY